MSYLRLAMANSKSRPRWQRWLGLTILELIVVMVILGVLAAIAIVTFSKVIQTSKLHSAQISAAALVTDERALAEADQTPVTVTIVKQAVSEDTATAAGSGTLAAGAGTGSVVAPPGSKLSLVSATLPDATVPPTAAGVVSAAIPGDSNPTSTGPTAVGVAFPVYGVAGDYYAFAYSATVGASPVTWVRQCPTGASALVAQANSRTACTLDTSKAPTAPSGVTASVTYTKGTTTVSWSPTGGGYVEVSWPGGSEIVPASTAHVTVPTTSHTVRVTSVNSTGSGSTSATPATVTSAPPTPKPPTTTSGCTGATPIVTVSWTAGATNGSPISSFTVTPSGGPAAKTVSGTTLSTKFKGGFTAGDSYTFSVIATNAVGSSAPATSNAVTIADCAAPPTLTSIAPPYGNSVGGYSVTLLGAHFGSTTVVTWGGPRYGHLATYTVTSTSLKVTVPRETHDGPSLISVSVNPITATGGSDNSQYFAYFTAPVLRTLTPTTGHAGTRVVLTGNGLTGTPTVTWAGTLLAVVSETPSHIAVIAPPHAPGPVAVSVKDKGGTSNALTFAYSPDPDISSLRAVVKHYTPARHKTETVTLAFTSGTTTIGTTANLVTIHGTNFGLTATVKFGTTAARTVTVVSSTEITCKPPAGAASGYVAVKVTVTGEPTATSGAKVKWS